MDDSAPPPERHWIRLDWKLVALLVLIAAGLRVWQLTHTEVAARDSIGFIRLAWQLGQAQFSDWPEVVSRAEQHPLYPAAILGVSRLLEPILNSPPAALMQRSAQLASALAAVLLVLPLYALGRTLFGHRAGFFSVLLLQCLPVSGQLFADGLSESVFLFWAASALYFGVAALRASGRLRDFALAGLCGGLAYLTRPEGALIVAAAGIVLLASPFVPGWERSWRGVILGGGALGAAALLLAVPFVACTGKLTVKPTGSVILEKGLANAHFTSGPLLAVWDVGEPSQARNGWALKALAAQLVKASFYVGWAAALAGIWLHRRRFRSEPGAWMMLLTGLSVGYVLWRVAAVAGYLSDRHTLLIQLCAIPWAAAGLASLGDLLKQRWPRLAAAPLLLPLSFALFGLPKTLETLHYHRAGFREAGLWLAKHTHPLDRIEDPLCWAHFYAGRVFLEHTSHPLPAGCEPRSFIVIEDTGNGHPRVPAFRQALARAEKGYEVYRWTGLRGKKKATVLIYAVPPGI